MLVLATPVATTCLRPDMDDQITGQIAELVADGLTVRAATARVARQAADEATAKRWRPELVDFVVIRTVDLGAQLAASLRTA